MAYGSDVGKQLGGYSDWLGFQSDVEYQGITSPQQAGGKAWYEGYGGAKGLGDLTGEPWISGGPGGPGAYSTIPTGQDIIQNDYLQGASDFRRNWYDDYLKWAVTDPVRSLGGQYEGQENIEGTEFAETSYVHPTTGQTMTGYLPKAGGISPGTTITQETQQFEDVERPAWEQAQEEFTWDPGHESYDEAKKVLDQMMQSAREERQGIVRGKVPAYQQAAAQQARTGMAYSGPAAQATQDITTEGEVGLGKISRGEVAARGQMKTAEETALDALDIARGDWEGAQRSYYGSLASIGESTEGLLQGVENLLAGPKEGHYGMGSRTEALGRKMSKKYAGAITGQGMFRDWDQLAPMTGLAAWMDPVAGPSTGPGVFGAEMASAFSEALGAIGE